MFVIHEYNHSWAEGHSDRGYTAVVQGDQGWGGNISRNYLNISFAILDFHNISIQQIFSFSTKNSINILMFGAKLKQSFYYLHKGRFQKLSVYFL